MPGKSKGSKATLHRLPFPSETWRRAHHPSGCQLTTQLRWPQGQLLLECCCTGPPPLPRSVSPHPLCCPLLILPQTRARKQNGGEASHYCRVEGNRMSPADRPAGLETWNCTHDFLFLCCQQITVRNRQVPTPLICMKDGNLPLAEVNPPAQTAEGHIVELQCSSSLLMIML